MSVSVKSDTYLYLAILLFLIPLQWLSAWLVAVIVHELSHTLAVKLCGGQVTQIEISIGGANMRCSPMSDAKRVFAILSGPIGGLVLLVLYRPFPHVAICAWLLTAYNLLPLLPLDGGRILQILMSDGIWFHRIQKILLAILIILALYWFVRLSMCPLPLVLAGTLLYKHRKTPCKTDACRVQ